MTRTKLDNIPLDSIQSISDLDALTRTNYAGSLRIAKLYALLAVGLSIQISIAAQPDSRTKYASNRLAEMHIAGIKKRITQVEAINARKASKLRHTNAMASFAETMIEANTMSRLTKLAPKAGLPSIAPEVRTRITAPIIADMQAKNTDESYSDIFARMNELEASRQTVPEGTDAATIVRELTPELKVIDTGDKLGSAEDWLK